MMSKDSVSHDPILPATEDAATVVGKLDANKDGASPASAIASPDKIKAVDDSVASVKKAAAAVAAAASSDVLLVDDIEGSEELQLSFPERLMSLLRNNNTDGNGGGKQAADITKAMRWLPGGEAFLIVPNIFYDVVLDGHFHGTKFESFTRKLNRWGFKRMAGKTIPKDGIAYHHIFFKKDQPELLDKMRSGRNRHMFVAAAAEHKPTKKQQAPAAVASRNNNKNIGNNHPPLAHQARAVGAGAGGLPPQGHSSFLGLAAANVGENGQMMNTMITPHMEADLVRRRRLDEAMHHSQQQKQMNNNNNSGYSQQADHGDGSFPPSSQIIMMMGGAGGGASIDFQRILAMQQHQQQQHQGMMMAYGVGGVDPLMAGCSSVGDTSSSYNNNNNNQDNQQQAHFTAMRQLLVDQRATARATENSFRLQQQFGGDFTAGSNNNSSSNGGGDGETSAAHQQDAKLYQLMRLRQQLDMVTRNS